METTIKNTSTLTLQQQRTINSYPITMQLLQELSNGVIRYPLLKNVKFEGNTPIIGNKELIPREKKLQVIEAHYKDVANGGLRGKHALFGILFQKYLGITFKDVSDFMDKQPLASQFHTKPKAVNVRPMLADGPNHIWQIDLMVMGKAQIEEIKYIINVVDVFSRKCWLFPIEDKTSATVALNVKKLFEEVGTPKRIHTDNGKEFLSNFSQLLRNNFVKHTFGPAYTPQAQGVVERCNQTVKEMMRRLMHVHDTKDWLQFVQLVQDNINNSFHSSLKMTPNQAYSLRNPENPVYKQLFDRRKEYYHNFLKNSGILTHKELKEKYKPGMKVRISMKREKEDAEDSKHSLHKGGQFSEKEYTIEKVNAETIRIAGRKERFTSNELKIIPEK